MKIFINYQLSNAFQSAVKRNRLDAIDYMVAGGMSSIKAICFIEAMSKDIADTWQGEKSYCMVRKSNLKCYDIGKLSGFRWYEVL